LNFQLELKLLPEEVSPVSNITQAR